MFWNEKRLWIYMSGKGLKKFIKVFNLKLLLNSFDRSDIHYNESAVHFALILACISVKVSFFPFRNYLLDLFFFVQFTMVFFLFRNYLHDFFFFVPFAMVNSSVDSKYYKLCLTELFEMKN